MTKQIISVSMARQLPRPFANPRDPFRNRPGKWSMEEREWLAMNYTIIPDGEYARYIECQRLAARSKVAVLVDTVKEAVSELFDKPAKTVAPKPPPKPAALTDEERAARRKQNPFFS